MSVKSIQSTSLLTWSFACNHFYSINSCIIHLTKDIASFDESRLDLKAMQEVIEVD